MRNLKESSRNPSSSGCEDLHNAARTGDLNVVQKILSSNPLAINSRDKHSRTPLHLAAWSGQAEVVNYLCKNKADVGAAAMDDMGAIHFAAQKGHLEVVRTLVLSGISVKASTRKGLTTLHYAAQGSHLELVKYLVRKGANISSKSKAGKTPLDLANSEEVRSYLKECENSAKKGNELNDRDKAQKSDRNPPLQKEAEDSDGKAAVSMHDVEVDVQAKRKGHEDAIEESSSEPKKARIALKHLLTADDNLDDNENL